MAATPVAGILGVDGVVSVRAVPLGDSLPLVRPEGWPAENVQDHSHRPHRHVVPASTEIIFAGQWHPRAEPVFSSRSHGFRKGRGCHTALRQVRDAWTGSVWFIESDISDCYGSVDHEILMRILAEKIEDQRFLRLIRGMLRAGYLEDWEFRDTLSGTPQGGVVTPPTQ